MFTNEIEFDETITTVVCDRDRYEDVALFIDENEVYMRQYNENKPGWDLIIMSPEMFAEMLTALRKPEGCYQTIVYKEEI
jgi:hypothetical protein